eukprot:5703760-Prymnesium_polylepis.1
MTFWLTRHGRRPSTAGRLSRHRGGTCSPWAPIGWQRSAHREIEPPTSEGCAHQINSLAKTPPLHCAQRLRGRRHCRPRDGAGSCRGID